MLLVPRRERLDTKSLFISVIIPAFNEEAVIEPFLRDLSSYLATLTHHYEIVVVDDGSRDEMVGRVVGLLNQMPVKLLSLSRNFGKEIAITAGLEHVKGEVCILMDADFQHPIETIGAFLEQWAHGYEMVYGLRQNRDNESAFKRSFARMFYWMMSKITQLNIPNNAGDFRLFDRKVVNALVQFSERTRFMKGLYGWIGFKKIGVPFEVKPRAAGKTSWGSMRLFELALAGIVSFSDVPLRVWGLIGFFISLGSLLYALFLAASTLLFGTDLPGFPTIVVAIVFLGGIQLLSIGILGEYIARIFTEVKHRPKYLIGQKYGFDDKP